MKRSNSTKLRSVTYEELPNDLGKRIKKTAKVARRFEERDKRKVRIRKVACITTIPLFIASLLISCYLVIIGPAEYPYLGGKIGYYLTFGYTAILSAALAAGAIWELRLIKKRERLQSYPTNS